MFKCCSAKYESYQTFVCYSLQKRSRSFSVSFTQGIKTTENSYKTFAMLRNLWNFVFIQLFKIFLPFPWDVHIHVFSCFVLHDDCWERTGLLKQKKLFISLNSWENHSLKLHWKKICLYLPRFDMEKDVWIENWK